MIPVEISLRSAAVNTRLVAVIPARRTGGATLTGRPGRRTYTHEQVVELLAEMAGDR